MSLADELFSETAGDGASVSGFSGSRVRAVLPGVGCASGMPLRRGGGRGREEVCDGCLQKLAIHILYTVCWGGEGEGEGEGEMERLGE